MHGSPHASIARAGRFASRRCRPMWFDPSEVGVFRRGRDLLVPLSLSGVNAVVPVPHPGGRGTDQPAAGPASAVADKTSSN